MSTATRSFRRSVAVLVVSAVVTAGCAGTARPAVSGTASVTTTAESAPTTLPTQTPPTSGAGGTVVPDTGSATTGPAVVTVDRCADGGVPVVHGDVDGAMGARYVALTAINCTPEPIELSGFPEIAMFDADGAPVDVTPAPGVVGEVGTEQSSNTVTVEPGASAYVQFSWRNTTETDGPVTAESLVVTPGAGFAPQTVAMTVDLGTTYRAYVTSWTLTPAEYAVPLTVTETPAAGTTG